MFWRRFVPSTRLLLVLLARPVWVDGWLRVRVNFDFAVLVICVGGFMVHGCACVCAELLVLYPEFCS